MSKCTIILFFNVFLCPGCSCINLYCIPVMSCCHITGIFNIAIKRDVSLTKKPKVQPTSFLLQMSSTKSGIWQLLWSICVALSFVFLLHFNVSVVSLFLSYNWCVSLGFGLIPWFVFSQPIYYFWTAVYYCYLYLW